jgi:glycosyltransferase involved in cell wall biosynthesis
MLMAINKGHLKSIIEDIDLLICSSNYVKNYFNLMGVKKNIVVLYPSLDFSNFNLPIKNRFSREQLGFSKKDFVWGMAGDISINKNPMMFIQAAERINKKISNVKFLWIGASDTVYGIYLDNYLHSIGLEKVVKFTNKRHQDYYQYLNELDGFLLTSMSESFSLASNESVCFNKHVVSFPCGGVTEAVPKGKLSMTNNFSVDELVTLMLNKMSEPKTNLNKDDIENLFKNEKNIIGRKFITILNSI